MYCTNRPDIKRKIRKLYTVENALNVALNSWVFKFRKSSRFLFLENLQMHRKNILKIVIFVWLCVQSWTWQWGGFSGISAEIGSSWVPYTTFPAVPIFASNSRRYSYSKNDSPLSRIRGVADFAYQWYGELPTPCITDMWSRLLPASLIGGVGASPHHRYGEKTLCIDDTESSRLPAPVIRWVADFPYGWVWELATPHIGDTGSRYLKKN
jgi:hypothetical protein